MSEIHLSATIRRNLLSLKGLSNELASATERVTTNKRVRSAIDDVENYYAANTLTTQSDRMKDRLDGMSETSEVINAADNGITGVKGYITQMKGLIDDALANSNSSDRRELGVQFNTLITQVRDMVKDSHYDGINLLYDNNATTVQFSSTYGISQLSVEGVNISAASGGTDADGELGSSSVTGSHIVTNTDGSKTVVTDSYALTYDNNGAGIVGIKSAGTSGDEWEIDWGSTDYQSTLTDLESSLEDMSASLSSQSTIFAADLSIISMRKDFVNDQTTILNTGADKLTLADLNEDSALILTLKNHQSIAVQCLSMSSYIAQQALATLGG